MHLQLQYTVYFYYFIWICIYLCCVYHIFKCEYTDTVSYAVRDQNFLREGEGAKPGHENFVNNRYNL